MWVDGRDRPSCWCTARSPTTPPSIPSSHELRGDSPPSPWTAAASAPAATPRRYSIERDFEDVAAVVDAVAARTGGPVALWGHSYGANCAMGGAALTANVDHLVLYEPSLGLTYPPGSIERDRGGPGRRRPGAAIVAVLVDILEMTDDEIDALQGEPAVADDLAAAPTLPRECRAEDSWVYRPGQFDAITAPTLLLAGSDTDPALAKCTHLAAAAIPDARIRVLDGHGHFAHKTDPAMVAAHHPGAHLLRRGMTPAPAHGSVTRSVARACRLRERPGVSSS